VVSAASAGYKTYVGTDGSAAYPIYCDELKSEIESFVPLFSQEGPAISGMAKIIILSGLNFYNFNRQNKIIKIYTNHARQKNTCHFLAPFLQF
jgi:hypothetical protein